jgi:hypothetical protein
MEVAAWVFVLATQAEFLDDLTIPFDFGSL